MNGRVGRLGLQTWLIGAFVLVGAMASLAVLLVVLPTLESSVLSEATTRGIREVTTSLAQHDTLDDLSGVPQEQAVQDLTESAGAELGGVARFTSLGGWQFRYSPQSGATHLPRGGLPGFDGMQALNSPGGAPVTRAESDGSHRVIFSAVQVLQSGTPVGVLEVAVPVRAQEGEVAVVRRRIFLAVGAVILLASLVGYWLSRLLGRRIGRLATTAAQLSAGDLGARAPEAAPQEVATVGASLNRMAERLQDLIGEVTRERDRARGLIGSLAEGVLAVSPTGAVSVANTAAERYLGLPREREAHVEDLPAPIAAAVRRVQDDPGIAPFADEVTMSDGTELEIQVGLLEGNPCGVVLTLRDVTDERRLERARRDLVANVSHELKTPLAALKGVLELMEDPGMGAERRRQFLGLMASETDRLERLVHDQLMLARLDAGALPIEREDIDLADVAAEVVTARQPLAEREGVHLTTQARGGPVVVSAEAARIEQILIILLDNALRHTHSGGRIDVEVGREAGTATLAVADTGEGIPVEAQGHVFDRFYQADPSREGRGTGLGLAIARGLAQAHGGDIDVVSAPGVGSTFTLRLPLRPPAGMAGLAAAPSGARGGDGAPLAAGASGTSSGAAI